MFLKGKYYTQINFYNVWVILNIQPADGNTKSGLTIKRVVQQRLQF
jgi:hypothetical protein